MTCRNCGATLTHDKCDYCNTKVEIEQTYVKPLYQDAPQIQPQQAQYQQVQQVQNINNNRPMYVQKSGKVAMWLACIPYTGIMGIHRFYVGKVGTGILYLFTAGLFGIGYIADIILISLDKFTDIHEQHLTPAPKQ